MRAKINDSLSAKVFLWIAGSLILCSFLIYGSILFFLPKSYVAVSSEHINTEIKELTETLSKTKFENSKRCIGKILVQIIRQLSSFKVVEKNSSMERLTKFLQRKKK